MIEIFDARFKKLKHNLGVFCEVLFAYKGFIFWDDGGGVLHFINLRRVKEACI